MKPKSLRARMLALSAIAALAALVIAAWSIAGILTRFVTEGLDQRLDAQIAVMASAVRDDGTIDRARIDNQIGVMTLRPDWRWRIIGPDGEIGSSDFPTLDPAPLVPPHLPLLPPPPGAPAPAAEGVPTPSAPAPRDGQDSGGRVHARQAVIRTSRGAVTLIAAAPSQVIARPIRAALVPLLSIIALLAVLFMLAALFQLRLALRPIAALRDQLGQIRHGTRTTVDEDQPAELKPLAVELNALSRESAAALQAARASAANLAHALKTPVATLALTVDGDVRATSQIARIEEVIRRHLARARTAAVAQRARTPLAPAVADVAQVIGSLHPGLALSVDVPSALAVSLDAHDLSEIVGNLLDNAARHARSAIAVTAWADGDHTRVAIEDDGPGIAANQRELALQPGVRLDEAPQGDGFGLAIVRDLVALHSGTLNLAEGAQGGLRVELALRAAR
ncbi:MULTISPECIES: HAMP domain-containing sensor histidine kinase [unclassified Novosphingobium]|uniref:sensor histidine kinase n=1 Tax=unclassified Novosphingobium TaxID=2644732 RepID=UPI00179DF741|nr:MULTISPECIES: HAMP domain-containing sensor histidine kinase [unclassified Novosphingobium]MBB3357430.1 signal transduction histidine kinase [Novosphingobium sp. BK256]MBB3373908.1 signal transduction histidine kinase [Novosphingobium sp. BK280]MBB3378320.1 signal transduction histidine kinase [Novosphingobium sp. BK258]MBB3419896.1 signal transduction histidine kinase [Novosphingobium sp. BK267]MBB3447783.1 signal transduction histidine kinase [Novosphingobium sp. BK352]